MGGFAGSITFTSVILKGFKWGFAAFVVALGAEYFLDPWNNGKKHH
jgi:NADH dehydrogenase (ubiquinone) 1 beta subcomplex subunit 3